MGTKLMTLTIEKKGNSSTEVQKAYGRLLGFIDDGECKAILNTEGAARKVFTSESAQLKDCIGTIMGSRLVFATYRLAEPNEQQRGKDFCRKILISPVIIRIGYSESCPTTFTCNGGRSYTLQEIDGD